MHGGERSKHVETLPKIGTVFVLDDDEDDQFLYRRVMERSGIVETVIQFNYPLDALEFFRKPEKPDVDVMIVDINMPQMDGFEFLERAFEEFGQEFARVVVVMLTTSINPKDMDRAKQVPVIRDYMNKPLTVENLEALQELVHAA